MAALMQGLQYGLSSQGSFDGSKALIFVKLTDSAYRAIEDFLKNKNHVNTSPSIQFLGNEGRLSFPTTGGAHGFNFSLTSNADIEGPQGSFECIQHPSSKSLESLGQLALKMRIHAKDDVYEATKHRMAVAEEAQKKNRTREIKPGGPGIGKKVKLTPGSSSRGRSVQHHEPPVHAAQLPEMSPALRPSYGGSHSKPAVSLPNGYHHHHLNGVINGSGRPAAHHRHPGNPDIMKRSIRERLIQLLAVRNYKKPELLDRLHRDGLRERDRKQVPEVLKQVSIMRDNTYQLLSHLWNDVSDKWPFYSEQDRQMVKRRRPQNLTPPGGSDGGSSSGSGQSPTSTHPGSPPPAQAKRPGYVDGADGLPTKRQRISHYRRPPATVTEPADSGGGSNSSNSSATSRWSSMGSGGLTSSRSANHTMTSAMSRSSSVPRPAPPPAEDERPSIAPQPLLQLPPHAPPPRHHRDISSRASFTCGSATSYSSTSNSGSEFAPPQPPVPAREVVREHQEPAFDNHQLYGAPDNIAAVGAAAPLPTSAAAVPAAAPAGTASAAAAAASAAFSAAPAVAAAPAAAVYVDAPAPAPATGAAAPAAAGAAPALAAAQQPEYPEYRRLYTTIRNSQQRTKYKADFNADYNEYRDLHAVVETVSRHFADLEERLRQEEVNSPGWKDIKQQIMQEYQDNKRDYRHQKAKRRFQYLHEKLSHIKRLVLEYDAALAAAAANY